MALENVNYTGEKIFEGAQDFLPINGTDYVELYVGNAKQSAHFYKTAFGFQSVAYSGLETGRTDSVSYVLQQDKIRLVLTSPLEKGGAINEHINKHGDGVKVVALWVDDATSAWEETTSRGAVSFMEPTKVEDDNGYVVKSGIHTYGESVVVASSFAAQVIFVLYQSLFKILKLIQAKAKWKQRILCPLGQG